jgi:hypothetical protein
MEPLSDRWVAALQACRPTDCDLDQARSVILARARQEEPTAGRRSRPKRRWIVAGGVIALGASLAGTAQLVTAGEDSSGVTPDGTRLGQIISAHTSSAQKWGVRVTGQHEHCIESWQGNGGGGVCSADWTTPHPHPTMSVSAWQERGGGPPSRSVGLATVIAPAGRAVEVVSYLEAQPTTIPIEDLPGVHHGAATIQGVDFDVWGFVAPYHFEDEGEPPQPPTFTVRFAPR